MPTRKKDKQYKIEVEYTINTSNLKIGQQLKYDELCNLIGAPITTGNSKKAQLSNTGALSFKRYFDFEKVGRGVFEITDIYDTPLPVVDKRVYGNNNKYATAITNIILGSHDYIANNSLKRSELWEYCGLINHEYILALNSTEPIYVINNRELYPIEIHYFFEKCSKKCDQTLNSALNHMASLKLIEWEKIAIVKNYDQISKATDEEMYAISSAEKTILEEYGYTTMFQMYSHFQVKRFYNKVNQLLKKRNYKELISKKISIEYLDSNHLSLSLSSNKKYLNKKIIDYMIAQLPTAYKLIKEEIPKISYDEFCSGQQSLINRYVKLIKEE